MRSLNLPHPCPLTNIPSSITYVLSGVLVPPFGLILELSWFTIPQALFISNILMTFAHAAFFIRVTGFILPLSSLGVAYALYGTAFWAGLAQSILYAEDEEPLLHDESSALVSNADGDEGLSHEATNEDDIHHNPAIGTAEATSDLVAMGVGIATSLLNLSTAVVPMLLAVVETYAGYPGLEITFIALAGFGCLASFQLTRVRDFPSHKIDVG